MEQNKTLQFDDAIDKLFRQHDGGQDTLKGVTKAADYQDRDSIPDFETAALLVSLDIFRGTPLGDDKFAFGADDLLARSAFQRMLLRVQGTDWEQVREVPRSEDGISCGEALEQVNALLGSAQLPPEENPNQPLTRTAAADLVARAMRIAKGDGRIPHLYYVPENMQLQYLELPENTIVASPDGTLATLTLDGTFMPLAGGYQYKGDIALTLTDRYDVYRYRTPPMVFGLGGGFDDPSDLPPEPAWWNDYSEPYRAALYMENGEKVPERSVDAAYQVQEDGSVLITSCGDPSDDFGANNFNGIIAGGTDGKYHIKDVKIRFDGNGMDDFQGMGAGILLCGDRTESVIENVDICNYGTNRSALVAGGSTKFLVKNSRFSTHEGVFEDSWPGGFGGKKMRNAPWMGGFEGNCRCTNAMDNAEATYFDSQILSEKWGVLSTDMNKGCKVAAINSLVAISGGLNEKVDTSSEAAARASLEKLPFSEIYGDITRDLGGKPTSSSPHPGGYGTYCIGSTTVVFAGSTVVTADFGNTCASSKSKVIYCASTPENLEGIYGAEGLPVRPQNTVVYTDKVGAVLQGGGGTGGVTIKDGTVFHCGATCFSVKSNGSYHIDVDDSTLISESGMILCVMDDDDLRGDIADPPSPTEAEKAVAKELIKEGLLNITEAVENKDVFVHFSNMDLCGDCYNACGYRSRITKADYEPKNGPEDFNPFAKRPLDSLRNLEVRLENVNYSGAITTAEGHHIDRLEGNRWLSPVPLSKWYNIAFVECVPEKPYQAGAIVHLSGSTVWNVTKTCYLTGFSKDGTSTLHGKLYVDGIPVNPEPGKVYTGDIIVQPGK